MEKTRAEFGKPYWCISLSAEGIRCEIRWEEDDIWDRLRFSNNNYFHSQEEAESMASKLRAVLNGADVIEMLSDINEQQNKLNDYDSERERDAFDYGFERALEFFKSKIVK